MCSHCKAVSSNLACGGEMVGDDVDLLALQDSKRLGPDVLEGCALGDAVIRKELQHVAGLVQVLVALRAIFIHPLLGCLLAASV